MADGEGPGFTSGALITGFDAVAFHGEFVVVVYCARFFVFGGDFETTGVAVEADFVFVILSD